MKSGLNAREKIVQYLAIRDHSVLELQQKMMQKKYTSKEIQEGIAWAMEKNLIAEPSKVSEMMSSGLHRKNKGILYINQYLEAKGLPPIAADWDLEVEKAERFCKKQFANPPYTFEQKQDIYRVLSRRGFVDQTIQQVSNGKNSDK